MIIETRAVPPLQKNGIIVGCSRTRQAVFIDPGDEVDALVDFVGDHDLTVLHILLTHGHFDHVSGVGRAARAFGVPVHLHQDDLFLYERAVEQGALFGLHVDPPPPVDRFYDGTVIEVGDLAVRVHHTPGHCPGGVCLEVTAAATPERHLFVGDTLFAGSIGRTDLPGGNYETLLRSITEVIFPLGDEAIVHPGHGPDTTVLRERMTNPFVLDYLGRDASGNEPRQVKRPS